MVFLKRIELQMDSQNDEFGRKLMELGTHKSLRKTDDPTKSDEFYFVHSLAVWLKDGIKDGDLELFVSEPWPIVKRRLGYLTTVFLENRRDLIRGVTQDLKARRIDSVSSLLDYIEHTYGDDDPDEVTKWTKIFEKLYFIKNVLNEISHDDWQSWARRIIRIRQKIARMPSLDGIFLDCYIILKDYEPGLLHPDDSFVIEALATSVGVIVSPGYEGDPEV